MRNKKVLIFVFLFLIALASCSADLWNITAPYVRWDFENNVTDIGSGFSYNAIVNGTGTQYSTLKNKINSYSMGIDTLSSVNYYNTNIGGATNDWAIGAWFYFNSTSGNRWFFCNGIAPAGDSNSVCLISIGANVNYDRPAVADVDTGQDIVAGVWEHWILAKNGTHYSILRNGTLVYTSSAESSLGGNNDIAIGNNWWDKNVGLNGFVDNVIIINWTITQQDIADMVNNVTTQPLPPAIPITINITLNYPANNYLTNNRDTFSFNFVGNLNTSYCTLYINNIPYGTNASVFNNTNTLIYQNATTSDGTYGWFVNCNGTASTNNTISYDTTKPRIALIYPPSYLVNYSGGILNTPNVNFSFYANDTFLYKCSINLVNYYGGTLTSYNIPNLVNGTNYFNVSGYTDGVRNWSISCNDTMLNFNTTYHNPFIMDLTAPLVSNVQPINNSKQSASYNVSFSITGTDFQSFVYSIQTNVSYANGTILLTMNYTDNGTMDSVKTLTDTKQIYENAFFNISYEICDGHTANDLQFEQVFSNDPIIAKETSAIDFNFVKIIPETNILSASVEKKGDRYSFAFVTDKVETETEILVQSKEKLIYYPNSKYKGHFIDGKNKVWLDFEDFPEIEVRKIDDYNYIVSTIPETKTLTANSIGALNCIRQTSYFNVSIDGLDVYIYDFSTGLNITTYNATINGMTRSTTNGTIHFNLTTANYNITFKANNYADKTENVSLVGYTLLNSPMYKYNSVLLYVYDEDTGILINNSEFLFDANTTYYQEFSTTNGSVYVSNIPSAYYDIRARSSGYVDRHYYITLTGYNYVILNTYLLNNSNAVVLSIKSEATDKFIEGAVVTLNRRINGTWSNVGSGTTDGVGSLRFGMKEGETYSLLISASGYETKQLSLTPFESAYTIYIQKTNLQSFYRLFDKLSFRIMPSVSVIPPYSYANPISCFNLTVVSPEGWVEWFAVNSSFEGVVNRSNITTSTGGIAQFCLNLSSYNGYNLSVDYWIKASGSSLWYGKTTYWINNRSYGSVTEWLPNVSDYSIAGVLENYKDEIPTTWKIIAILVIAIGLMLTFAKWLPPEALGFIGVTVIGVMAWYWFNAWFKVVGVIIILAFAILFLLRSRGGE